MIPPLGPIQYQFSIIKDCKERIELLQSLPNNNRTDDWQLLIDKLNSKINEVITSLNKEIQ